MLFSFVGEGLICPGAALDYVPRRCVGEKCMVRDTHVFGLQIRTSTDGEKWCGIGRLSTD
jgi:hypothetical protein